MPETIAWPAIWYSTSRTSEPSSFAVTVTLTGPVCQPVGIVVLSMGASVSSDGRAGLTVVLKVFQSLQLPALSCTRVLSTCGPAPLIVAWAVRLDRAVVERPLDRARRGRTARRCAVMEILRLLGTVAGDRRRVDRLDRVDADGLVAPAGEVAGDVLDPRGERVHAVAADVGVGDAERAGGDDAAVDLPLDVRHAGERVGAVEADAVGVLAPGGREPAAWCSRASRGPGAPCAAPSRSCCRRRRPRASRGCAHRRR